jgi:nucleoside transporter
MEPPALASSSISVNLRLFLMMFLQFFIWGAWYVPTSGYLTDLNLELSIGWVYTVGPIAAIISPVFLGMIADRYFAAQRVLAILHLLGGVVILAGPMLAEQVAASWAETTAGMSSGQIADEYGSRFIITEHLPIIALLFLHMLFYMPTLGLTNTIAFRNMRSPEKQFPLVRVFGTIGWIAANFAADWGIREQEYGKDFPLYLAGGAAILLGVLSFGLPHTPPVRTEHKPTLGETLGLRSLALLRDPSFAIFALCSMLICIPLAAYYSFAYLFVENAGFRAPVTVMSTGQMSEIIFMLLMPLFFARLGVKWMLLVGMLAWVVRYALFAMGAPDGIAWMILFGILLHGICYDFFFVTGFIYTDKKAPQPIRAQAQGFLVLLTQGIGLGVGAQVIQRIVNANKAENYDSLVSQASALREQSSALAEVDAGQADALWNRASELFLQTYDWQQIWLIPCLFAAGVALIFFVFFRDRSVNARSESLE